MRGGGRGRQEALRRLRDRWGAGHVLLEPALPCQGLGEGPLGRDELDQVPDLCEGMRTQYYEVTLEVHAAMPPELVKEALWRALDWERSGLDCSDLRIERTGEDDPVVGDPEPQGQAALL